MSKITSRYIEEYEMKCSDFDDLVAAIRQIEEMPEADFELSVSLTLPGLGEHTIKLLDDVPISVKWRTETD